MHPKADAESLWTRIAAKFVKFARHLRAIAQPPQVSCGIFPQSAPYAALVLPGRKPGRQPPRTLRVRTVLQVVASDRDHRGVSGHMGGLPVAPFRDGPTPCRPRRRSNGPATEHPRRFPVFTLCVAFRGHQAPSAEPPSKGDAVWFALAWASAREDDDVRKLLPQGNRLGRQDPGSGKRQDRPPGRWCRDGAFG